MNNLCLHTLTQQATQKSLRRGSLFSHQSSRAPLAALELPRSPAAAACESAAPPASEGAPVSAAGLHASRSSQDERGVIYVASVAPPTEAAAGAGASSSGGAKSSGGGSGSGDGDVCVAAARAGRRKGGDACVAIVLSASGDVCVATLAVSAHALTSASREARPRAALPSGSVLASRPRLRLAVEAAAGGSALALSESAAAPPPPVREPVFSPSPRGTARGRASALPLRGGARDSFARGSRAPAASCRLASAAAAFAARIAAARRRCAGIAAASALGAGPPGADVDAAPTPPCGPLPLETADSAPPPDPRDPALRAPADEEEEESSTRTSSESMN
jgi:hypothetical protein